MEKVDGKGKDFHCPCDRVTNEKSALHRVIPPLGTRVGHPGLSQTPEHREARSRPGRVFAGSHLLGAYCVHWEQHEHCWSQRSGPDGNFLPGSGARVFHVWKP